DRHLATDAFLIRLRSPQRDQYALGRLLEVVDVERDKLGASEGTREAEQQNGAVAKLAQGIAARGHAQHQVAGRSPLAHRRRADRPADPAQYLLHLLVGGGRLVTGSSVEVPNSREPATQRTGALPQARLVRQEGAQRLSGGRQRV